MHSKHRVLACGLLVTAFFAAACGDVEPTQLAGPTDGLAATTTGKTLVECPTDQETSTIGTLDLLGGTIRLDNHALNLPAGAVLLPTEFRLRAPASRYMELSVTAVGFDSFDFLETATITIDYSRCTRSNIDGGPLTVWKIDPVTKELIREMGGVDNKLTRTITFQTDGLSTYSLAR